MNNTDVLEKENLSDLFIAVKMLNGTLDRLNKTLDEFSNKMKKEGKNYEHSNTTK